MSLGFAPSSLDKKKKKKKKKNSSSNDINFLKNSFLNYFKNLSDPRRGNRKDRLLIDIVAIAILAVISNADNWNAIRLAGSS